uniref:Ferredoxin 2 n=1 Tax=Homo sapiens TaxID=9606 RepID=A0A9L9PXQ6_HUMAN
MAASMARGGVSARVLLQVPALPRVRTGPGETWKPL